MFKCERKVVRKFTLETKKLMHSLCPTDRANKPCKRSCNRLVATMGGGT